MGKKLTPKEQIFCNQIVKGVNPSQAYINAYKPTNQNKNTIATQAQKILRKPHIVPIIEQGRKEIQQEIVYTAKDSFNSLLYAQQMAEEQKNVQAWLKAEELKGKLLGLYTERIKAEVEGKIVQVVFNTDFKGL